MTLSQFFKGAVSNFPTNESPWNECFKKKKVLIGKKCLQASNVELMICNENLIILKNIPQKRGEKKKERKKKKEKIFNDFMVTFVWCLWSGELKLDNLLSCYIPSYTIRHALVKLTVRLVVVFHVYSGEYKNYPVQRVSSDNVVYS